MFNVNFMVGIVAARPAAGSIPWRTRYAYQSSASVPVRRRLAALDLRQSRDRRRSRRLGRVQRQPQPVRRRRLRARLRGGAASARTRGPSSACTGTCCALSRQNLGGTSHKAIAGIELALWDIKGKSLGVPVYELFGGPMRDRVQLYWSHCGTTRARHAEMLGLPPLRSYDDIVALGREVVAARLYGAQDEHRHPRRAGQHLLRWLRPRPRLAPTAW